MSDCTYGIIGSYSRKPYTMGLCRLRRVDYSFNPDEELYSQVRKWIEHYARLADVAFAWKALISRDEYIPAAAE